MKPYWISREEVLETEAGYLRRFIRKEDMWVREPEEVYFSEVRPGVVRGWYLNKVSVANICVVHGEVSFLIREETEGLTYGPISLSPRGNERLTIQPRSWYAFRASGSGCAVICNALENRYKKEDCLRMAFREDPSIWAKQAGY